MALKITSLSPTFGRGNKKSKNEQNVQKELKVFHHPLFALFASLLPFLLPLPKEDTGQ
jgi:hypothetical protein